MTTLRHTRYQAAIIQDGALLLLKCAFRNGPTVWMLPGGGRDEGEEEQACIVREVSEETGLDVRVVRMLYDCAAHPPDGTYVRWRTFVCAVESGEAKPGGGEGASADLVDVMWLQLSDETSWPVDIREDEFLYPQLKVIRDGCSS